jgi:hypothetical protein
MKPQTGFLTIEKLCFHGRIAITGVYIYVKNFKMELTVIQNKIYEIRGHKVMLDKDLAILYEIPTKSLNLAVKRNMDRFPPDFMFQLSREEFDGLRFQNETSKRGGTRYLPYAFTELGVAMLSSIVNSPKAIQMNIFIMRAFVLIRQYAISYKDLAEQINGIRQTVTNHHEQLNQIYDVIENLLDDKTQQEAWNARERIGFKKE